MKTALVLALCFVVASAQWDWNTWKNWWNKNPQRTEVLDYVHGYRFEEHSKRGMRLLIAIGESQRDKSCHVIEVDDEFAGYLQNEEDIEQVTDEIYHLIKEQKQNETLISRKELREQFDDHHLIQECWGHDTFKMVYEPSFNATGYVEPDYE